MTVSSRSVNSGASAAVSKIDDDFFFENVNDAIFIHDLAGNLLKVNHVACRRLGYTRDELLRLNVPQLESPENASIYAERIRELERTGHLVLESQHRRKDGEFVPVEVNARLFQYGDSTAVLSVVRDITQRKRAEEELRQQTDKLAISQEQTARALELLETLLANAPIGICFYDTEMRFLEINPCLAQMDGIAVEETLGRTVAEIVPGLAPAIEPLLRIVLATGQSVLNVEIEGHVPATPGQPVYHLVSYYPVRDSLNNIQGIGGIVKDITQIKQAEQALRQAEVKFRNLFEHAVEGIFQSTPDGRYLRVNSAMAGIYGYASPEEMMTSVGNDIQHRIYADPARRTEFVQLMEERGAVQDFEVPNWRRDGSLIWTRTNARSVRDTQGTVLYYEGFVEDISERKQLEQAVQGMLETQRQWNAELEDKVRAKTVELRRLSETRDQLLRQIIVAQEEEHRRIARELHDETSQALTALIANLAVVQALPASKAKAQLEEIKVSVVEILKGVNQIVLDLRPTLLDDYGLMPALSWYASKRLGSQVRVEITAPEPELRLPASIETTLFRIGQEALANVAQHANAIHVRMSLACAQDGKEITLVVADDGIGFSVGRVESQDQAERPHWGLLGMRERVQLIGGRLRIQSELGKGTLIAASIPWGDSPGEE